MGCHIIILTCNESADNDTGEPSHAVSQSNSKVGTKSDSIAGQDWGFGSDSDDGFEDESPASQGEESEWEFERDSAQDNRSSLRGIGDDSLRLEQSSFDDLHASDYESGSSSDSLRKFAQEVGKGLDKCLQQRPLMSSPLGAAVAALDVPLVRELLPDHDSQVLDSNGNTLLHLIANPQINDDAASAFSSWEELVDRATEVVRFWWKVGCAPIKRMKMVTRLCSQLSVTTVTWSLQGYRQDSIPLETRKSIAGPKGIPLLPS